MVGDALEIVSVGGERWSVTERDCRGVPGARGVRCLIFMSDSAFRRIWSFPADWRTLSAVALMEISWQR
jgi:hypothetical protein